MKILAKLTLVSAICASSAFAVWVPGHVEAVLQDASNIKVGIKRSDTGDVMWRYIPTTQQKTLLAGFLTALSNGNKVSCNVSGANFDKCFFYNKP